MSRSNRLFNRGFCALLITQFFGAINDSVLKQVIILAVASGGVWANQLGEGGQAYVALCLTIPFILFSGIAGQIADRISKNRITVLAKIAEVGIAALALGAFFAGNLWACLVVMVLLATQSAFFGPAKYGMIPELLKEKHLSKANGSINMFTNLAVIGGTLAAGKVYTHYSSGFQSSESEAPINPEMLWVPGVILVIIAMIGLLPSLFIPKLKSFDQPQPIDFNPFRPYVQALKDMAQSHLLLVAFEVFLLSEGSSRRARIFHRRTPEPRIARAPIARNTLLAGIPISFRNKRTSKAPILLNTKDRAFAVPRNLPLSSGGERCCRRDCSGTM
ncbi:MFS transporter [Akkermansiaceae bacterium]|nr:MFS transporter [Akkermansiaceae bacterium]